MDTSNSENAPIEIVPYCDHWPALFASELVLLQTVLSPWLVADIEHVGSTAVVGLHAKPIIDIMAPVRDLKSSRLAIESAQTANYCYFPYKSNEMHWFCKPTPAVRTHHLHLVPWKSRLWQDRLVFRNELRLSRSLAMEYTDLKLRLAAQFPFDREAYTEGKSTFVLSVIESASASLRNNT